MSFEFQAKAIATVTQRLVEQEQAAKSVSVTLKEAGAIAAAQASDPKILALSKDAERIRTALSGQESTLERLRAHVSGLNAGLSQASGRLGEMERAAGLTSRSGAGAEVAELQRLSSDASAKARYLADKGVAASEIAAADKEAAAIAQRLEDAEKRLRIATYEFQHSDAYKEQLRLIDEAAQKLEAAKRDEEAQAEAIKSTKTALDDLERKAGAQATAIASTIGAGPTPPPHSLRGLIFTAVADVANMRAQVSQHVDAATSFVHELKQETTDAVKMASDALTAYERLTMAAEGFKGAYGNEGFDPKGGPPKIDPETGKQMIDPKTGAPMTEGIKTGGFITAAYLKYLVDLYAQLMTTSTNNANMTAQEISAIVDTMKKLELWWSKLGGFDVSGRRTIEQVARSKFQTTSKFTPATPQQPSLSAQISLGAIH